MSCENCKIRIRGFEPVKEELRKGTKYIMPIRKTKGASGYDLSTPVDLVIKPHSSATVYTNIKAYMREDEELKVYVRSSIGIKKNIMLANSTGKIDSDYYGNPTNDGNIIIALFNYGNETQHIKAGERIAQATFSTYLVADNCNGNETRQGGVGSTGK